MTSRVTATGPIVDGRALREATKMTEEVVNDVAQHAFERVGIALDTVLKHPTGYYESQITVDRAMGAEAVVHDQGVIYGPWLAGVGSRNAASRFKGYTHWRRATQHTQRNVLQIAAPTVAKSTRKMNGR
jgi:hypothetical protein